MLSTAAKYAKPTKIQNHTRGLYQFIYSILLFPPEGPGEKAAMVKLLYRNNKSASPQNNRPTCHIVSDSHSGESDHNKVDGLQRGPALDVFKDDSRDGDKNNAASQDEQDGGCDSNFCLADLSVFLLT